jgi:hypothetical protein
VPTLQFFPASATAFNVPNTSNTSIEDEEKCENEDEKGEDNP